MMHQCVGEITVSAAALVTLALASNSVMADETMSGSSQRAPEFVRDVVPVLTKAGCNSGACHGSFQGRGGMRLSLLGFDPPADYQALVQEGRGRRTFPAAPDRSLVLLKATGSVPHGGGTRLAPGSEPHRRLREWIAAGLPRERKPGDLERLRVQHLKVEPGEVALRPGQAMQVRATATWSDGERREVTDFVQFGSQKETVATVSAAGMIEAVGPGRAAVTLQYLGQVATVVVTVPFSEKSQQFAWQPVNFIDELAAAQWRSLGLAPAPAATDAQFLRRVYLDLTGTLPRPDEVRTFLASSDPEKRAKAVDELLERSEYVDYWTMRWGDWLRAHRRYLGEKGLASFQGWLRGKLRENRGVDELARELLTAKGNLYARGPVAYYFVDQAPPELAETTAQILLGVRIQCAKCHHHPFEVWSQDDYYGLAAFFAGIERKDTREAGRFGGVQSVQVNAAGVLAHPAGGGPVAPRVLGEAPAGEAFRNSSPAVDGRTAASSDPRERLAAWVVDPKNPHFARNIVNRHWGLLFGRGLVEPVDDQRATNPASNPALLDAVTEDFVKHGFDTKHLLRTICRSRVYQLAAEIAPQRDADAEFLTHRCPQRLAGEVLLDAVNQACGTSEPFAGLPEGQRAIALPDSSVPSYFLDVFGRPQRNSTCDCERGRRPDLKQVLHLVNGEALQAKVSSAQGGRLAKLVAGQKSDEQIIEELYLATLSRFPDGDETATARKLIGDAPARTQAIEDLLWALLNCPEFSYNH